MRKALMSVAVFTVFMFVAPAFGPATAKMASTEEALSEKILGKADAPITILAFESLTCPHCAAFHRDTLGQLKKAYIDTGKAKLIFIDFPLDARALAATMLARCTGNERFFPMLDILFSSQEKWASSPNFMAAMEQMSRLGGLTESEFQACMRNEALYDAIRKRQEEAQKTHSVSSTPTFVINGVKVLGAQPFAEFDRIMKPMLP